MCGKSGRSLKLVARQAQVTRFELSAVGHVESRLSIIFRFTLSILKSWKARPDHASTVTEHFSLRSPYIFPETI